MQESTFPGSVLAADDDPFTRIGRQPGTSNYYFPITEAFEITQFHQRALQSKGLLLPLQRRFCQMLFPYPRKPDALLLHLFLVFQEDFFVRPIGDDAAG